jgi:hypothetical protein
MKKTALVNYEDIAKKLIRDMIPKGEQSLFCIEYDDSLPSDGVYIFSNFNKSAIPQYHHNLGEWRKITPEQIGHFINEVWPEWKSNILKAEIPPGYELVAADNGYFVKDVDGYLIHIGASFRDALDFLRVDCVAEVIKLIGTISKYDCLDGIFTLNNLQGKVTATIKANYDEEPPF